jgi:hypothetical protein
MKKLLFTSLGLFLLIMSYAQTPDGFNYQAVIRDSDGNIKTNEQVSITISIIQGNADGEVVYLETHNPTTNNNGLINLIIGKGNSSDNLGNINWSKGPYYLKIEVDGESMGTSQLMTVPFAKYADKAGSFIDKQPNKGDILYYNGSSWATVQTPTNTNYKYTLRWSADKDKPYWHQVSVDPPLVQTGQVTEITSNSAKCSGEVLDDGDAKVTTRGIVWNSQTSTTLTLEESNVTESGNGLGKFTVTISNLNSSTEYYSRAFAVNVSDTSYGSTIQWETVSGTK